MKFIDKKSPQDPTKRAVIKVAALGAAVGAGAVVSGSTSYSAQEVDKEWGEHFQQHYKKMTPEEVAEAIDRLERRYAAQYDVEFKIKSTDALPGVLFGYALNINRCKGYRECVKACTAVNNQDKEPDLEYIRVLEMEQGTLNLEDSDHYFSDEKMLPEKGKIYLPIQCHQCEEPPCVASCPVEATWKEPDGIVVVDYNWCIGCRMCLNACPYWARRFNWREPNLPKETINPDTHYLSNRPREKGVMEKCTFCLQRTRQGEMPACQEACPTGARVFGNLLDPESEIRYVLENKQVFRLKEDLNTQPKFWYYSD